MNSSEKLEVQINLFILRADSIYAHKWSHENKNPFTFPIVYSYKLLPGAEEKIYDKISDITISMKAVDYLDMPELITTEYPVYLDEDEMVRFLTSSNYQCPYYRLYDEYGIVKKQN